jgi:hypothetical protein
VASRGGGAELSILRWRTRRGGGARSSKCELDEGPAVTRFG